LTKASLSLTSVRLEALYHLRAVNSLFRLCVAAITHGAHLAESRDIAARLKTNSERFEELCLLLDEGPISDAKRAIELRRLVSEINRYRFVGESGLSVAVIVGAVKRAVKGLMNLQIPLRRLGQTELLKFALVNTNLVQFRAHRDLRGNHIGGHIVYFYNVPRGDREDDIANV
jgi:hypothetical protein